MYATRKFTTLSYLYTYSNICYGKEVNTWFDNDADSQIMYTDGVEGIQSSVMQYST